VQLIHEFTLLHDDIMDHDEVRRGRPKAWRVFSTERALLAGDALLTLAVDVLARVGIPRSGEALRLLSESVMAVIRGQSADLAFEAVELISDEQAREVALGKTAALFGAACGMGA
jgi:geranylgeranyl diphosphate synthase type I